MNKSTSLCEIKKITHLARTYQPYSKNMSINTPLPLKTKSMTVQHNNFVQAHPPPLPPTPPGSQTLKKSVFNKSLKKNQTCSNKWTEQKNYRKNSKVNRRWMQFSLNMNDTQSTLKQKYTHTHTYMHAYTHNTHTHTHTHRKSGKLTNMATDQLSDPQF